LAVKKKTGVLTVKAPPAGKGLIGLNAGRFCLAQASTIGHESLEDALVEILSWSDGAYSFEAGEEVEADGDLLIDVATVLADVAKQQAEWEEIKKEIPSLKAKVELIVEIGADAVELTGREWMMVALIGRSATIEELQKELKLSPLAACRDLLGMSRKGLIRCLGEVTESEPPAPVIEPEVKVLSKKYIRRSLHADEEVEGAVPAEWASYYQLLDARQEAANGRPAARVGGH